MWCPHCKGVTKHWVKDSDIYMAVYSCDCGRTKEYIQL